ncbi:MAG: A/G-specific adenine glycosylase [Pirellulales bacterium]
MSKVPFDDTLLPAAEWRGRFRRRLRAWYRRHARDLPWRSSDDAFHIWVSEIMLQQTQVSTVKPYFLRFVSRFPTIADLAKAEERDVMRLWEGLGYYRRARQLHKAAREVMAKHDGVVPRDSAQLQSLPGIGRYTAGAIASIAFDAREPILEANTIRLLARLLGYQGDTRSAPGQALLWDFARAVLPRNSVGEFNQALMELGSLVCKPKAPDCHSCPARSLCAALAQGKQDQIPIPPKKADYEAVREAAIVVRRNGRILLRQCEPGERWSGLWDFPRVRLDNAEGVPPTRELVLKVRQLTDVSVRSLRHVKTIKHGVTRFSITLDCYEGEGVSGVAANRRGGLKWLWPKQLDQYPLSSTGRKLARFVFRDSGAA